MPRIISKASVFAMILLVPTITLGATSRQWQSGKLLDTERETVKDGSITHYTTEGKAKTRSNGKTDYSQNTTAQTTENTDNYEVYTIEGPERTYIAREKLLFPWSKPANVTVGADVNFVTEGRKLIILDEDQKEHKASIVKTTLNHPK